MNQILNEHDVSGLRGNGSSTQLERLKALVFERTPADTLMLQEHLARARQIVVEVMHPDTLGETLVQLREDECDVVLLGLDALDEQGLEILRSIHAAAPNVPVIVLAPQNSSASAIKALQSGAQDYLVKGELNSTLLERAILHSIERKRAEEALRRSEARYGQLVNSIDGIVWEADAQTVEFTFVSKQAERLLGYPTERWLTEPTFWPDHMHPEDRDWAPGFCAVATREQRDHEFEYRMIAADGRLVWLRDIVTVVSEDGRPVKLRGVMIDITKQKEAEEESRLSEERFRALFEQAPFPVRIFSPDGVTRQVNKAWCDYSGMTPDQLDGRSILDDEWSARAGTLPYLRKAFAGETTELPLIAYEPPAEGNDAEGRAARKYWMKASAYAVKDSAGAVQEVVFLTQDVTEQKEAEDHLREKEEQYRSIFEATSDGLVINDLDGRAVEVNPAFGEMHGYSREELVGFDLTKLHPPGSEPVFWEYLETVGQGRAYMTQVPHIHRRKDGTLFNVEVNGTAFTYNGKPHILGVIRDVTERVKAYELLEQRVEERTRELSTLLNVSHDVTSTLELEPLLGRILDQIGIIIDYSNASVSVLEDDVLSLVNRRIAGGVRGETVGQEIKLDPSGPIWQFLQRGEPVIVPDVRADDPMARSYRARIAELFSSTEDHVLQQLETEDSYIRSWLAIPLRLKQKVIGLLSLSHHLCDYYGPRHMAVVNAIANQAAIAIENARLYNQAQQIARTTAALEERQRLARELHDSVSQALFSISLTVRAIESLLLREASLPEAALKKLADLRQLTQGAQAEMRALIFELRPRALEEEGLLQALRKHGAAVAGRELLGVEVVCPDEATLPRLKPAAEQALYRIAQEALHNVVKHAQASRVEIHLLVEDRAMCLRIADDGRGFERSLVPAGHMGLGTMSQRAVALGGEYTVDSTPGEGTTVTVRVPLANWQLPG
jgi:PAS domain S-box-containing protein